MKRYFPYFLIIFPLLILVTNIKLLNNYCLNVEDFGIYEEAIMKLASLKGWNPFLEVRGLAVFNDHFDPILILVSFLLKPVVSFASSLLVFEILTFIIFYILAIRAFKKEEAINNIWPFVLILIFNKAFLMGLHYPVHPTTWAIPVLFFFSHSLLKEKYQQAFLWALLLILFKETFGFIVLFVGLGLILKRKIKIAIPFLSLGFLHVLWGFFIRKKVMGTVTNYSGRLAGGLLEDPLAFVLKVLSDFNYFVFLKDYYPLMILIGFFLFDHVKNKRSNNASLLFLGILPIFGVHFLFNRFNFHYYSQFMAWFLPLLLLPSMREFLKPKMKWFLVLIFIINAGPFIEKTLKGSLTSKNKSCVIDEKKALTTKKLMTILAQKNIQEPIIATGNIIPTLLTHERSFHHLGGASLFRSSYQYLLFTVHEFDFAYPYNHERMTKILNACRPFIQETIYQDEYAIFLRGQFPWACLAEK